jgi:outer membrane receptor protein involved in Fe transport
VNRPLARIALLLAALLTTAPQLRADDLADQAELEFSLGAEAYQHSDFRAALEHFLTSNRLVPNKNVLFNIARSYEQLKSYPEAFRYYFLALDGESNPDTRAKIESAIAQIKQFVTVLRVATDPPGATLYIDRRDLGAHGLSPQVLGLTPRKYTLIAERAGYEPAQIEIPLTSAGQEISLNLKLEPILGKVMFSGEPGVQVSIKDEPGTKPCSVPCGAELPIGSYIASVSRPGFRSAEIPFTVPAHERVQVKTHLDPQVGIAVISTDEPGALVEIDGKASGFTPAILTLPAGPHRVRLSLKGFRSEEWQINVRADGEQQTRLNSVLTESDEVVAASRASEQVEDAPSSVSLVPQAELSAFAPPTIAEAVRGVPGVYLSDDRSYVTLGMRGIGRLGSYGNRILVTYDGQPMNDDWIGSSYVGYDALTDLGDVERIEVVRGPGSVLYGTNALSGVINVVSRSDAPPGVSAGISTNQNGVARARVRGDVKLGNDAGGWASVAIARGNGRDFRFPELAATTPPDVAGVARNVDGFDSGTFRGRVYWKFLSTEWSAQSYQKHLPSAEYGTLFGDARTQQTDKRYYVELRAEPRVSDTISVLTRLHWNHYTFRGAYPRDPVDGGLEIDTFHGSWVGLEQRVQVTPVSRLRLTFGGEGQLHYQVEQQAGDDGGYFLNDTGKGGRPFRVGALYALADATLSSRAHLSLGARLDAYSTFGSSLNPRAALILKPYPAGNTKILAGRAFRAPSIYELHYNDGGYTQIPSPGLDPESMYSLEVEHAHRFSASLVGTAAAYGNYAAHLISTLGSDTQADPLHYQNETSPLVVLGGEVGLRREFRQGAMFAISYGVSVAHFLSSNGLSDFASLTTAPDKRAVENSPVQMASLKAVIPIIRALSAGSRISIEGPRYDRYESSSDPNSQGKTAGSVLWDIVLSGDEPHYGVHYAVGVYNALDWHYSVPVSNEFTQRSIEQNGRSFLASVDVKY